jgi:hypothetical protein
MLESNPKLLSTDLNSRILFRKLKVRKQLRNRHLPVFDFDQVSIFKKLFFYVPDSGTKLEFLSMASFFWVVLIYAIYPWSGMA